VLKLLLSPDAEPALPPALYAVEFAVAAGRKVSLPPL
jgi:hypothetical protein